MIFFYFLFCNFLFFIFFSFFFFFQKNQSLRSFAIVSSQITARLCAIVKKYEKDGFDKITSWELTSDEEDFRMVCREEIERDSFEDSLAEAQPCFPGNLDEIVVVVPINARHHWYFLIGVRREFFLIDSMEGQPKEATQFLRLICPEFADWPLYVVPTIKQVFFSYIYKIFFLRKK